MRLRAWITLAARDFRGSTGRIVFFAACLAVGVAAVVAVAGLSSAIDDTIRGQARQLLAADLAVSSRRPIEPVVLESIDALPGVRRTEVHELPSVVSVSVDDSETPGASVLCEIKAVGGDYPYYGVLETEPRDSLATLLDENSVVVAPELLVRLDLDVGDVLRVGNEIFTITGVVTGEPDRMGISFTLGPRVLLSLDALDRTGLVGLGSRVRYRVLVRLPDGATRDDLARTAAVIRAAIEDPEFVRLETYAEAQPSLRSSLGRVERFLGLVALLSLLIGGIGVAQAVRAWLAGRLDAIAVMRALGTRPREIFGLYLSQTAVLALLGSLAGAIVGAFIARAIPVLVEDLLPVRVSVGWQPEAMARGVVLGIGVAVLFGLRPLVDAMRVPPVRVLRRDADPLPVSPLMGAVLSLALVVGITATAAIQSGSVVRGLLFAGGLILAAAILAGSTSVVIWLTGRIRRDRGLLIVRHGLAALARPGSGTLAAVVALGLGVLTVLGMFLIQERLSAQFDADLPDKAPTVFLVDIQPDQWAGVRAELEDAGATKVDSVEVVMARLASINGVPVAELARGDRGEDRDRRWVLTREQRLTSMATLPADNIIVDGALWAHPERAEVSVEQDFASDMGVEIGDSVVFNIQGIPVELLVSSIRSVDWGQFSINFFLVVEPGVLDRAPRFRIATARLEAAAETSLQNNLAAVYPNVTVLRLREVLDKVVAILEQVGDGVRFLGGFSVLAGIAILAGAVSAGALRRGRQVALFKTIGMTRAQVVAVFAVEYALVGLVAGALGTVGAVAMAWTITRYGFELAWSWLPGTYIAALLATVALSVVAGIAASARALAVRPLAVLRQGE